MKKIITVLLVALNVLVYAQETYTIQGHFPNFPNSNYELKGYKGVQQVTIATAESKEDGKFILTYPKTYVGNAQLYMNGAYQNLFLLNKENIHIFWEDLTKREDMQLTGSKEYDAFLKGMKTFQDSEAKVAGLHYLIPLYEKDSIKQKWYANELDTVANTFPKYIKSLPDSLYVQQYLLTKGLIEQMPNTVKTYTWRAPAHVPEFMAIDFKALKHSGLYKDLIEGYTSLVERFPLEEVNPLLTEAIDKVVTELQAEAQILNDITLYWLPMLEKKSLLQSAEYLALKMLEQHNATLTDKSKAMLERYHKLAVGNIAPNVQLTNSKTLKDINNNILLIFGSAECHHCTEANKKLLEFYPKWQEKGNIEVVYISIDTDKELYNITFANLPFTTYCSFKGWDTQAAKDYYITGTPTYFLLNKNNTILAKPNTLEDANQYISHKL
ncbi:MAG: thioredoxin family protein [Winogradskyella sp.]